MLILRLVDFDPNRTLRMPLLMQLALLPPLPCRQRGWSDASPPRAAESRDRDPVSGGRIELDYANGFAVTPPCCNQHDCRPAHFRVSPEGVSMLVEGSWLRVPDELVVYRNLMGDRGDTRGGHWCGATDWGQDGVGHNPYPLRVTYCAIVPPSFALVPLDKFPALAPWNREKS